MLDSETVLVAVGDRERVSLTVEVATFVLVGVAVTDREAVVEDDSDSLVELATVELSDSELNFEMLSDAVCDADLLSDGVVDNDQVDEWLSLELFDCDDVSVGLSVIDAMLDFETVRLPAVVGEALFDEEIVNDKDPVRDALLTDQLREEEVVIEDFELDPDVEPEMDAVLTAESVIVTLLLAVPVAG